MITLGIIKFLKKIIERFLKITVKFVGVDQITNKNSKEKQPNVG